ncbi:helix-turn-helix domain-containing protein [Agrobacterium arsenijevicii]|uniref:HTH araC/xylS-type domain-containing protein n=1 Tax=Agrobacterium arsenijevicii TaxID=1585697 RepID=A0ABR5CYR5_9HYPH|nr:hypothetical protein RP75_29135 [Agrobacterium arsenijevicii]
MATIYRHFDGAVEPGASEVWERTIEEIFGDVEFFVADRDSFAGQIRSSAFGKVEINNVGCSYENAKRTNSHIGKSAEGFFALSFVMDGSLSLQQGGRDCDLGAGSYVLFDLDRPYSYQHSGWTDILSIKLPTAMLAARLKTPHNHTAVARCANQGVGRVTRDTLVSFANQAPGFSERVGAQLSSRFIDLTTIMLETREDDGMPITDFSSRKALYDRILRFIDGNLHDCELDAPRIAAANRISIRYLHRIFQETGQSVGDVLRTRRLERCYQILSAGSPQVSVKEIALGSGFRSQSHFATVFRKQYGLSPSDLRGSFIA